MTEVISPFEDTIHSYSRADALTDGTLRDVTALAGQQGILLPTAIASHAWGLAVAWNDENGALQDETGRLWDVLTMAGHILRAAARQNLSGRQDFSLYVVPNAPGASDAERVVLGIEIGPGDCGEPVLTITAPGDR